MKANPEGWEHGKGYDLGEPQEKPAAMTPPRAPVIGDIVAIRHAASDKWVGPMEIVDVGRCGDMSVRAYMGQNVGLMHVPNGYGSGWGQWRYVDEVGTIETHWDRVIDQILRATDIVDSDNRSRILFGVNDRLQIFEWMQL